MDVCNKENRQENDATGTLRTRRIDNFPSIISIGCPSIIVITLKRLSRDIHAHLIGDLRVVRLQGVLTAAEQQLVKSIPSASGRNLLKQVRTDLIETARPVMEAMIQEVTDVKVLSLHDDISTVIGEEVVLFTLAKSPDYRQPNK